MAQISPQVYNDLSSLTRLKAQSTDNPEAALNEAAKQFEALFVTMMMKAMRDTLPEDSMFGSSSMDTYQEMFDQQLALDLSRTNGIGLSDVIARQLSGSAIPRQQEALNAAAADEGAATGVRQQAAVSAYSAASAGSPAVAAEQASRAAED